MARVQMYSMEWCPYCAKAKALLGAKGSLFLTRPSLFAYVAQRSELLEAAAEMFDLVRSGILRIEIRQTYPLAGAAQAHRDLEGRKTTGSTVLLP